MRILYRPEATAKGGRTGHAATKDGALSVDLVTPKELGGPGGEGTNPEQLFAAGYAACVLSALKFIAGHRKVAVGADASATANVGIGPRENELGFGLDVSLSVSLPGLDRAQGEAMVQAAHIVCPYSHATRGSLEVKAVLAA